MTLRRAFWISFASALGLLALLVVGGLALDGDLDVEASAVLDAPPEVVYALVATPEGLQAWWTEATETLAEEGLEAMEVQEVEAASGAPAAEFRARGNLMERWTLLERTRPDLVRWSVDLQVLQVERTLLLSPEASGTRVTWREQGRVANPMGRYMLLALDEDQVVASFQVALAMLGEVAARDAAAE